MARRGERVEDALSGATLVFRQTATDTGGELLQVDVSAKPRWSAGPIHIHPRQEERVDVLAGRLRARVGDVACEHGPGDALSIPPGTPHTLDNAGDGDVHLVVEFRPALRMESLLETAFGVGPGRRGAARLRDLVRLLVATRGYRDEIRLAWRSLFSRAGS
jgi:quercetin dioxygenase-like cupin family protein